MAGTEHGLKKILVSCVIFYTLATVCAVQLKNVYKNQMRHHDYDYIIVGAGSAGSVLANRLSEELANDVLVLEAGDVPSGMSEIPVKSVQMIWGEMDWRYITEPQENACHGYEDKRCYLPRGKALGGSSSINGMQYVRGERRDFDEWAKGGATGWNWDNILYYFKKAEDQRHPEYQKSGVYGEHGYQTLEVAEFGTPLREAYYKAMEHLGYSMTDINSGSPLGYSKVCGTVRDGLRCSQEKAFLRPAASRENLDILTGAHVVKILFDQDKRATSVRFERNNVTHVVSARKEIILSAGVFGSAQILMLSGIGPKEHLEELKIPLIADLPVGENLQDHITVNGLTYSLNSNVSLVSSRLENFESLALLLEGRGPLTVPAGVECFGILNTKFQKASENWPDLRLFFFSSFLLPPADEQMKVLTEQAVDRDFLTILPMVARPKSRGYVRLRSTDPYDHPIINPKYLTHDDDLKILIEGMKTVEQLIASPALQEFDPVRYLQVVPGCENFDIKEEDYRKCWARRLTESSLHQCCTCKMGNPEDPTTVVDPELRVKGVSGLRVVDGSVMPTVTSGNTMATCIMIGEKAADLIMGKYWDQKLCSVVEIPK